MRGESPFTASKTFSAEYKTMPNLSLENNIIDDMFFDDELAEDLDVCEKQCGEYINVGETIRGRPTVRTASCGLPNPGPTACACRRFGWW